MFTGLIEEVGVVREVRADAGSTRLVIACQKVLGGTASGDSIAVNGCCLTAVDLTEDSFSAVATPETLSLTNLSMLKPGSEVNLERSVTLQTRLGGHIVQGHVDGLGKVVNIAPEGDSQRWEFTAPTPLLSQMIMKGSITVNGVSLTIAGLTASTFSVALIPKTIEVTTFRSMQNGDAVNLEADMIGKYVFRYMETQKSQV